MSPSQGWAIGWEDGWRANDSQRIRYKEDYLFVWPLKQIMRRERRDALALAASVKYGQFTGEYPDHMNVPDDAEDVLEALALGMKMRLMWIGK